MKLILSVALLLFTLNCLAQDSPKKSIFLSDSATYKGMIKGYIPKPGVTTGMVYINNVIKGVQESNLIRVEKDGSFSAKFLMYHPQDVFVSFPGAGFKGCSFSVYMEPGKEVFQSFDPITSKDGLTYPASTFSGDLARINTELAISRDLYHQITYSKEEVKNNPLFYEELLISRLTALINYKERVSLSEQTFNLIMEQLRFPFKVVFNVNDEEDFNYIEIPTMLLQPFVENAVKHGVANLQNDGVISIDVVKKHQDIILIVKDNGSGFERSESKTGLGLKLSEKRIALLNKSYKDCPIVLHIDSSSGTIVKITLNNWLA